jgi:hypothetical protein
MIVQAIEVLHSDGFTRVACNQEKNNQKIELLMEF